MILREYLIIFLDSEGEPDLESFPISSDPINAPINAPIIEEGNSAMKSFPNQMPMSELF